MVKTTSTAAGPNLLHHNLYFNTILKLNSYVVVIYIYIYVGPQDLMLELDKRKLVVNLKPNNKRQRVIIQ